MKAQVSGIGREATWLELAVAPAWRLDQTEIQVHPMEGQERPCYALTLEERWLCGSDNALSVFHSFNAAQRFLEMLRVSHFELGSSRAVEQERSDNFQCFSMGSHGLTPCEDCEVGRRRREKANAAAFDYWGDDSD